MEKLRRNMENNIKLVRIESKDKSILQNLFQLYMHDITASLPMDVNEHGLFEYNYIDCYFTEENRYAYLIYIDNKIGGFALIDDEFMVLDKKRNAPCYDFSEMFILNSYKKKGYGDKIVKQIFDMYKGNWEIRPVPRSEGAKRFWLKVVKSYTGDNFVENYPKPNRLAITFKNN